MQSRTYITFSLSIDATDPLDIVKERIENAMNCKLAGGFFGGVPAFVGEMLGIRIGLLCWRGIAGIPIFQFHGMPDPQEVRGDPWQEIRIDQAVIDLLERNGAGLWREPSLEEHKAAAKFDLEDI